MLFRLGVKDIHMKLVSIPMIIKDLYSVFARASEL